MVERELKSAGGERDPYLPPYGTNPPERWRVWGADPTALADLYDLSIKITQFRHLWALK